MQKRILKTILSNISIVITAAGSSTRMGSGIKKEYLPLKNGTVLSNCAKTFLKTTVKSCKLKNLVITYPKKQLKDAEKALFCDKEFEKLLQKLNIQLYFVEGSDTRQSSVFNAIKFLNNGDKKPDYVLIHDGARPFVTEKIIFDVINAAIEAGGSVCGVSPTDTIKEIDESGMITKHLKRQSLISVQTPQGFEFDTLYEAHCSALKDNIEYTDDTQVFGAYGKLVKVVPGDINNIKITYPGDLERGLK